MNLSGLLTLLVGRRAYDQLVASLGKTASSLAGQPGGRRRSAPVPLPSAPMSDEVRASILDPAKPYLLAALQRDLGRPMLVVVPSEGRARDLAQQVEAWSAVPSRVIHLPAPEPLPYERLPSHPNTAQARLRALQALAAGEADVVVASTRALMRPVMAPERFRALTRIVRPGEILRPDDLVATLIDLGYAGEALVEYAGTFSRRGGIVDVFPVDASAPLRVEFFGDEVESVRAFDPTTQRSRQTVPELRLSPSRETLAPTPEALERLRALDTSRLNEAALAQWTRDLERLADNLTFDGFEFYAPYVADHGVLDYLGPNGLVVLDESASLESATVELVRQSEDLRVELLERAELPSDFAVPYFDWPTLENRWRRLPRLALSWRDAEEPGHDGHVGRLHDFHTVPSFAGQIHAALDDVSRWRERRLTTVLVTQQAERVTDVFGEAGTPAAVVANVSDLPEEGALVVVRGSLAEGFELSAGAVGGMVLLTDRELFGWTKQARAAPPRRPSREAFLSDLSAGDYVVHVDHGVGRFVGMIRKPSEAGEREYLVLDYASGDRLYVPADQTDRVERYVGVGDHAPMLHRLGTSDWTRARTRVKAAVRELAGQLLRLYASRQSKPGYAFGADTLWQREMEDAFPYQETADQLKAISDVKTDMETDRPMDRLLCGDVGYGKTEVALRAAFKAVNDGKQVAVLVPTTVLAQQHYNTFRERLQAYPVKVEMLSRFRSDKEQKRVIEGLNDGSVDICIGTHRLVQKDVRFKNLGLVIVDEEQRFGVLHKEHFKKLRTEVDVLTLTATPIPRTLHLALVGARDLSVMDTPPEDRLPIRTTVTNFDDGLIREVILREIDRGGQIYFVHNRVQTIYQMAHRLAALVPQASIAVGHGQMPEEQLEKVMLDFAAGRYDVLVCSTIIESGLDIPNVNTIIVNHADHFGLAQLYQLRGRVGRGANRAYAYFLTQKDRQLTEIAEKRLRTIFEASDLGAGYRIALKDLEFRGAGNILGAEQHGNVAAVGFHLYTKLLADAVKELKGEKVEEAPSVIVDLPLDAYLPPAYVEDEAARLNLYTRLATIADSSRVGELMLELRDRFGEVPEPALNLIYLVQLKLLAAKAGVQKIQADADQIVIQFHEGTRFDARSVGERFRNAVAIGRTQIRLSRKLAGFNWMALLQDVVDVASGEAAPPAPADPPGSRAPDRKSSPATIR